MADLSRVGKKPDLPEIFRRTREVAGLTQEAVCSAVGLTQSTYSRFELGQVDLDVSQVFALKTFLDKQERKKGGAWMQLSSLLRAPAGTTDSVSPSSRGAGKLTEEIAKELEAQYMQKEADELDRQLDEELPALREKVLRYERLLDRDTELIRSMDAEIDTLKAEVANLKAAIPKVKNSPQRRKKRS